MDDNNNRNYGDYSSPEPYNPDAEYGFAPANEAPGGGTGSYQSPEPNAYQSGYQSGYQSTDQSGYQSGYQGADQGGYQSTYQNSYGSSYSYGNGNYSSGYGGPAPLDKKGRPLENRFGMKLTFSIIEMVIELVACLLGMWCIFGIPLILSIIGCVMVCLQNKEYHESNWNGFVSKKNAATALLWVAFGIDMAGILLFVLIVVLIVLGVGVFGDALSDMGYDSLNDFLEQYESGSTPGEKEYDWDSNLDDLFDQSGDDSSSLPDFGGADSDGADSGGSDSGASDGSGYGWQSGEGLYVDGFNEFKLNGASISLPMSVSDFCKEGFWMYEDDLNSMVDAKSYDGFAYCDESGNYLGTVFVYNIEDVQQPVSEGIIGGMTINRNDGTKLKMAGGITFKSSVEDLIAAYGVPTGGSGDYYGDYAELDWYMYDDYGQSLEFDLNNGEISEVWIMNDLELKKIIYGY